LSLPLRPVIVWRSCQSHARLPRFCPTTENPSFVLNGALLSRCQVMMPRRLDDAALERLLARSEAEIGHAVAVIDDTRGTPRAMAGGDGRYLFNMTAALPPGAPPMDAAVLAELLSRRAAQYDKDREEHYIRRPLSSRGVQRPSGQARRHAWRPP
jgi:replication-associated recombination protein RarA